MANGYYFVPILLIFGLLPFVPSAHVIYRRSVTSDDSASITTPATSDLPGRKMDKDTTGYSLIQHNNPDYPGEKRGKQDMNDPLITGVCNPDLVCLNEPYRSIDGSCNNLNNPGWGKTYQLFLVTRCASF